MVTCMSNTHTKVPGQGTIIAGAILPLDGLDELMDQEKNKTLPNRYYSFNDVNFYFLKNKGFGFYAGHEKTKPTELDNNQKDSPTSRLSLVHSDNDSYRDFGVFRNTYRCGANKASISNTLHRTVFFHKK